ncbi:MAG: hypothetical protein FVQ83_07805 [Chloroflexi bacterium]|nr:hypothetical protein [Chloroflexota bacterium]
MKKWFTSLNGAITLSVIAFLSFMGRAFLDWRWEYPAQDPLGNWDTPMALTYLALAGLWIWGLLAALQGSRKGLITSLVLVFLLDVTLGLSTYFFLCPPWEGCEGWPNAWPWNWSNVITGVLAMLSIVLYLRQNKTNE